MANLSEIKKDSNWGEAASTINSNFQNMNVDLEKVKSATTKFRGYFTSETVLKQKYPSPQVGDTAYVGEPYPGTVYDVQVAGTWHNTGTAPDTEVVDLTEYARKEELTELDRKTDETIIKQNQTLEKTKYINITTEDGFFIIDKENNVGYGFSNEKGFIASKIETSTLLLLKDELENVGIIAHIENNSIDINMLSEDLRNQLLNILEVSNDGFSIIDKSNNIGLIIGSLNYWLSATYNRKYGWGGYPYGSGTLPPYNGVAGIFEADLLSVRGGKGRWNNDDTNNFKHGGHLFEGWNAEEDVRLTAGIGLKNKHIAWLQTFHPATEEGSDEGAYYGITKIGSDIDREGVNFMPSFSFARCPFGFFHSWYKPKIDEEQYDLLVEAGEITADEKSDNDKMYLGAVYYCKTTGRLRIFTKGGKWRYLEFQSEFNVTYSAGSTGTTMTNTGSKAAFYGQKYTATIQGDVLPSSVTAKIGADEIPCAYNNLTGEISINADEVIGDIQIIANV